MNVRPVAPWRRIALVLSAALAVAAGSVATAAASPAPPRATPSPAGASSAGTPSATDAAARDPALAAVAARLARPATLRGRFEQEKRLAGFRNPLRSSGDFLLVRGRGVAWDTTAPFASSAVLTPAKLSTRLPGGDTRVLVDAAASPATAAVTGLFLALVEGDLDALAARFDVVATAPAADGRWTLALRPRDDTLAKAIADIELSGREFVEIVRVREKAGDETVLRFLELTPAPPAAAAEVARFD